MYKENLKMIDDLRKSLQKVDVSYDEYSKKYYDSITQRFLLKHPEYQKLADKRTKKKEKEAIISLLLAIFFTNIFQNLVWIIMGREITWFGFLIVGFQLLFTSDSFFSFLFNTIFLIILPMGFSVKILDNLTKNQFFDRFLSKITETELKALAELDKLIGIEVFNDYEELRKSNLITKKNIALEIVAKEEENKNLFINDLIAFENKQNKSYMDLLLLLNTYSLNLLLQTIEDNFKSYKITYDLTSDKANSSQLNLFQNLTLKLTDKIMIEEGLNEYGLVDITRSTNNDLVIGTYFYSIQKNGDVIFMEAPYLIHYEPNNGMYYALFDYKKYQESKNKKITIANENIHDFQLFGSELVESSVQTIPNAPYVPTTNKVSVIGTLFNEYLFGSAYATLNGVGKMMSSIQKQLEALKVNITTVHRINDTRKVQLILKDQSDLELKGISIYYDFNRKMGNVKNKIQEIKMQSIDGAEKKEIVEIKETNTLNSLLEAQKMLKENLITKEEFDAIKLEILGSKKSKN
jgi:hypothetical protein